MQLPLNSPWFGFAALVALTCARRAAPLLGLSAACDSVEIALTRRLKLFDREFYRARNTAPLGPQTTPLRDYVTRGDARSLSPLPLFDPVHYSRQVGRALLVNRLLHYGLYGRHRRLSPSPWFDLDYYLKSNPDVVESGQDPLRHFLRWGWQESRSPLPGFDLRQLANQSAALRVAKTNPMLHYLRLAEEGELPWDRQPQTVKSTDYLDDAAWADLQPRTLPAAPVLDVIVPVYAGTQETLRCLWTVLKAPVCTSAEIVVINDASPEAELAGKLRALAARGLFTLLENKRNLGFVKTVNRGLRLHPTRDVVILNADTEVYNDWLDKLTAHAASDPAIATITPLSNNATICSYPETLQNNWMPLEVDHATLDQMASRANPRQHVDAPTGVGFCMFMRRACMTQIGLFDERRFGRGYGEENDFCRRAAQQGWRNVVACDTFVAHKGSVSFRAEATQRLGTSIRTLRRIYPDYQQLIDKFIAADPLLPYRMRLDIERLKQRGTRRNALLVSHNRGGGTERFVAEQTSRLREDGVGIFELRPSPRHGRVAVSHPELHGLHNTAALPLSGAADVLLSCLRDLGITEVHLHHLVDFDAGLREALRRVRDELGAPLRMTVHDYYTICPRINLVSPAGRYCGEPDVKQCDKCLQSDNLYESSGPIEAWRKRSHELMVIADAIVVPDEDVALRLGRYLHGVPFEVRPHEPTPDCLPRSTRPRAPGEHTRVLVIGAISRVKGFDVVLSLAAATQKHNWPLSLELLGFSSDDPRLQGCGVKFFGRYVDTQLQELIEQIDPHVIFLPSIWPETYCYVLTAAMRTGRRIAVFNIGAQARRLRASYPVGERVLLPLALADDPRALYERLTWAGELESSSSGVRDPSIPCHVWGPVETPEASWPARSVLFPSSNEQST